MKGRIAIAILAITSMLMWNSPAVCYGWGVRQCLAAGVPATISLSSCGSTVLGTVLADATFWSACANRGSFGISTLPPTGSNCYFVAKYVNPCTGTLECGTGVLSYLVPMLVPVVGCPGDGLMHSTPAVTVPSCCPGNLQNCGAWGPFRAVNCW